MRWPCLHLGEGWADGWLLGSLGHRPAVPERKSRYVDPSQGKLPSGSGCQIVWSFAISGCATCSCLEQGPAMRRRAVESERPGSASGDKYLQASLLFHLAGLAL